MTPLDGLNQAIVLNCPLIEYTNGTGGVQLDGRKSGTVLSYIQRVSCSEQVAIVKSLLSHDKVTFDLAGLFVAG